MRVSVPHIRGRKDRNLLPAKIFVKLQPLPQVFRLLIMMATFMEALIAPK